MIKDSRKWAQNQTEHAKHPSKDAPIWTSLEGDLDRYYENLGVNIFAFFFCGKASFLKVDLLAFY